MSVIETDYLVVGAGATGMAFVDALIAESDVDVVMVDRRHRPGGHWLDAYPFVRLHQPSACYGVTSRVLANDRVDDTGPNRGFYERSTAAEICDYYTRVLDEVLLPSGRVRFLPMTDYRGAAGGEHQLASRVTGAQTTVTVRRRLVDATYGEASIPSRHRPDYQIDPDVRLIPPNALVDLDGAPSGFTILGAGKTAMDTCSWLLNAGVDPDQIRWVKPRDGWFINRMYMQPLEQVGSYLQQQAAWLESAAACTDAKDFARRFESTGVLMRLDPNVEPEVFRGATLSVDELEELRSIDNVVRHGRVRRIEPKQIHFDSERVPSDPQQIYVDCTAEGLRPMIPKPVFETGRITPQYVTAGIAPWSAATIAAAEVFGRDDTHKNTLCPPIPMNGEAASMPAFVATSLAGTAARMAEPNLTGWNERCRLNPTRGAAAHMNDPKVQEAFTSIVSNMGPAMQNLQRVLAPSAEGVAR